MQNPARRRQLKYWQRNCPHGHGLDKAVFGNDPIQKHGFVDYVELDDQINEADIIVCAMNLTDKNRGLFNYEPLSKAKPGAPFINIARRELSPADELPRAPRKNS